MPKLLCIVGGMNVGGAETFLMKIFRTIDRKKYQIDFCVAIEERGDYDDEIESGGGIIYHVPPKTKNFIGSYRSIKKIVLEGKYTSVLRISQNAMSSIELFAAKRGGAKILAFRSSNTGTCGSKFEDIMHTLFKPVVNRIANVKLAPSKLAADFMFGRKNVDNNKVYILNNGLNIAKFVFDLKVRERVRKENLWSDKFLLGHIGRFEKQKNHEFVIEIFERYLKNNQNAHLVLVGDGETRKRIEKMCEDKKISEHVSFLGIRSDINEIMMALDILLLPSLFEGMPNVAIEAQTTGLPCVLSDTITREAGITNLVQYISLNIMSDWIMAIEKVEHDEKPVRTMYANEMHQKGYSIEEVTMKFINLMFE